MVMAKSANYKTYPHLFSNDTPFLMRDTINHVTLSLLITLG